MLYRTSVRPSWSAYFSKIQKWPIIIFVFLFAVITTSLMLSLLLTNPSSTPLPKNSNSFIPAPAPINFVPINPIPDNPIPVNSIPDNPTPAPVDPIPINPNPADPSTTPVSTPIDPNTNNRSPFPKPIPDSNPTFAVTPSSPLPNTIPPDSQNSNSNLEIRLPDSLKAKPGEQEKIKKAFLYAWRAYAERCFGEDELEPLTQSCHNWLSQGLTIVDSLDTMFIMGLKDEFKRGKEWIRSFLRFDNKHNSVSIFETVIRILGGLLSAYSFDPDPIFLNKAEELTTRLLPGFKTPTGIPYASVNLESGNAENPSWTGFSSILSEIGSIQLEFVSLSYYTRNPIYRETAEKIIELLSKSRPSIPGLFPIYISPENGRFGTQKITWGAMGDSLYEYLLKMWLLTNKQNSMYKDMYQTSVESMRKHLLFQDSEGLYYIADKEDGYINHKMDHLVCFVPGMLALGAISGIVNAKLSKEHLSLAENMMETCYQMYAKQPSFLAPEYATFSNQQPLQPGSDAAYKLRPETVESLFVLYRITGNQKYREWGWKIFEAIEQHCRLGNNLGYTGVTNVRSPSTKLNKQESYFMAETLKYLYLLFSDSSLIPLDKYVFNTECHPLPIISNSK